jgi:hypothetical protein
MSDIYSNMADNEDSNTSASPSPIIFYILTILEHSGKLYLENISTGEVLEKGVEKAKKYIKDENILLDITKIDKIITTIETPETDNDGNETSSVRNEVNESNKTEESNNEQLSITKDNVISLLQKVKQLLEKLTSSQNNPTKFKTEIKADPMVEKVVLGLLTKNQIKEYNNNKLTAEPLRKILRRVIIAIEKKDASWNNKIMFSSLNNVDVALKYIQRVTPLGGVFGKKLNEISSSGMYDGVTKGGKEEETKGKKKETKGTEEETKGTEEETKGTEEETKGTEEEEDLVKEEDAKLLQDKIDEFVGVISSLKLDNTELTEAVKKLQDIGETIETYKAGNEVESMITALKNVNEAIDVLVKKYGIKENSEEETPDSAENKLDSEEETPDSAENPPGSEEDKSDSGKEPLDSAKKTPGPDVTELGSNKLANSSGGDVEPTTDDKDITTAIDAINGLIKEIEESITSGKITITDESNTKNSTVDKSENKPVVPPENKPVVPSENKTEESVTPDTPDEETKPEKPNAGGNTNYIYNKAGRAYPKNVTFSKRNPQKKYNKKTIRKLQKLIIQ